jgi:RNA polymerase sigma factor (TIGR02999 family)
MRPDDPPLTQALTDWRNGDQDAGKRLFAAAYQELRRLAAWHLRWERPGHTLQATALVNELYLKLFGGEPMDWRNRAHFFAVAAQQMRRLLVDYARAGLAEKRGGGRVKLSLTEVKGLAAPSKEALLDLDAALRRLETLDPRSARIVELRYFGGATEQDAAEAASVSVATVKRDWEFARTWLISQLKPAIAPPAAAPRP